MTKKIIKKNFYFSLKKMAKKNELCNFYVPQRSFTFIKRFLLFDTFPER